MKHVITIRQVGTTARPLFVTPKGSLTTDLEKAESYTEGERSKGLEKAKKLQKTYPNFRVWVEEVSQITNTPDTANTGRGNINTLKKRANEQE